MDRYELLRVCLSVLLAHNNLLYSVAIAAFAQKPQAKTILASHLLQASRDAVRPIRHGLI